MLALIKTLKAKRLPKSERNFKRLLDEHKINCVFDVGANVGQYAQSLRKIGYEGRIVSFEPLSKNIAILQEKSKSDSLWEIAPQMAVGAIAEEVEINVSHDSDMSSILDISEKTLEALPGGVYESKETVQVKPVASFFEEYVDEGENVLLKVDTQGYEMSVLEGAENVLDKITGLQLELSFFPLYDGEKLFDEVVHWLKEKSFAVHLLLPGYFSRKLMRQMQADFVFFRNS